MFKVIAHAPTVYQFNSVKFFGNPVKKMNGSFTVEEIFDTEEEAKQYLHNRIDVYAETNGTEEEINEMREQVDNYGSLNYDAVGAHIEEV